QDLCEGLSHRHQMVRAADKEFARGAVSDDRYEFVHALYRDVFYRRQPPGRRARLHCLVGEQLETLYAQRLSEAASELANHFEQARDWPRAIKYCCLPQRTPGGGLSLGER